MSSALRWATSPTRAAPGTRETDLLHPTKLVDHVHAIKLAGGSTWGLDVASAVMQGLEENPKAPVGGQTTGRGGPVRGG